MPPQGMRELVGRVMVDPEFLARLARSPESELASYHLTDNERAIVLQALARMQAAPTTERTRAFRSAIVQRLAT
jgi:hypothetical protein